MFHGHDSRVEIDFSPQWPVPEPIMGVILFTSDRAAQRTKKCLAGAGFSCGTGVMRF
jgi:hypothetical protein